MIQIFKLDNKILKIDSYRSCCTPLKGTVLVPNFFSLLTRTRMAVPLLSGIEVFRKNFAFPFELGPVRPPTPELTFYGGSFSV